MRLTDFSLLLERQLQSPLASRFILIIAGALYPLAFAPVGLWPLAFFSICFLLYVLTRNSILSAFRVGFYWGLGAFSVGASWVYVSIHEFGHAPVIGAFLLTLLFVAYLAVFKGLFAWFCCELLKRSTKSLLVLIAPLAWLISEYLQAWVFGGFPWLLGGYSQIDSPLASLATWTGIYGVSWFLVALSAVMLALLEETSKRMYWQALALLIGIVIVANVHQYQHQSTTNKLVIEDNSQDRNSRSLNSLGADTSIDNTAHTLSVALVQPNIAQEIKWDRRYFSQIVDILYQETESLWDAELIVWPEGAIPAYAHQVNDILADLQRRASDNDSSLILGIPEYKTENKKSYVAMLSMGGEKQTYHKQVLVPFGEYVPLEDWLRGAIEFFDLPMSGFTPAVLPQEAITIDKAALIPAICYEIVYPDIIRELAINSPKDLPKMIVTISNDAWFGDSFGPYQHMEMARMRALELGVPLIRSTNDGITAIVDYRGNILKSLPRYQQGSLRAQVSLSNRATIYRQYGSVLILFLLALTSNIVAWSLYQNHGKK